MTGSTAKTTAAALLTIGAMTAGVGLASGLADAQPGFGTFVAHYAAGGPWTWCPGQDMTGLHPDTGRGGPGPLVQWDGPNPPEDGTPTRQGPPISFMCP